MITIETENYNHISQDFYNNTINSIDLNQLPCTCGLSGSLIFHGSYKRKVQLRDEVLVLTVVRVRCSACGQTAERTAILAEELGHHYTSVGNILDPSDVNSRKQERQTRLWSYNRMFGLEGLIDAYQNGYREFHEVAEYLEVPEEELREAVKCYRSKYGTYTVCGDYYIIFEPYLMIGKNWRVID